MEIEQIVNEDFYVWVAPDGNMQLTLLAPDETTCEAVAKLFHKSGIGQSPHQMRLKGYDIKKVKVTIV
ncbi:hypothetical protein LCGC14_0388310 [marine sediment metagenome]|uniref:Uncharacterized protein n=1 Tax=marine sediment metagenome TaxID=412755 RepID=A0A0F9T5W4_9ZZZZ